MYVPYYSAVVFPGYSLAHQKPCILSAVPNRPATTDTHTQELKIIHTAIIFKMNIDLGMVIEYKILAIYYWECLPMRQISNIKQILNNTKFRRVISSRRMKKRGGTNVNQGSLNASFL